MDNPVADIDKIKSGKDRAYQTVTGVLLKGHSDDDDEEESESDDSDESVSEDDEDGTDSDEKAGFVNSRRPRDESPNSRKVRLLTMLFSDTMAQ